MDKHQAILILVVLTFLVLSLAIHEAAHAFVARMCGDDTAEREGRLTLNPIDHIDPFMTVLLPLVLFLSSNGSFVFGGAKPVPVNPHRLRNPSRDMMFVALAGPISNLVLSVIFMIIYKVSGFYVGYSADTLLMKALYGGVTLNIFLALFNMIPIPPLDGSRVVMHFLPHSKKQGYAQMERFGIFIILGLFWMVPGFRVFLGNASYQVFNFVWLLTGGSWA
ncbi:MAG: site-2 protease family protein [Planctomycetota bacterium]|nr:site-2 protease family protein [Planctomycetota bacterium]